MVGFSQSDNPIRHNKIITCTTRKSNTYLTVNQQLRIKSLPKQ